MRLLKVNLLFCFFLYSTSVFSQHLFPEKFKGCNTEMFALEQKTESAKKDKMELAKLLLSVMPNKAKGKVKGKLFLQIIVYKDGSSCLLSADNKTNVKSKKLGIPKMKKIIDEELTWVNEGKNVATLVLLVFKDDKVSLTRLGVGDKGLHELKE